jgi:hypothetical protein
MKDTFTTEMGSYCEKQLSSQSAGRLFKPGREAMMEILAHSNTAFES